MDERAGRGNFFLKDHVFRYGCMKQNQALTADFRQVRGFMPSGGLTQISQHQAAHIRCPAGGLHGGVQAFERNNTRRQIVNSHFDVSYYNLKVVVEMVGNGPGHAVQALGFLQKVILGLKLGLF